MARKYLIAGAGGQLGRELTIQLKALGVKPVCVDIPEFDITDDAKMAAILDAEKPDWVFNCGAMTNVDGCETARDAAMAVNGEGPGKLAKLCHDRDIVLTHVSTDYVFSGEGITENGVKRPYVESDAVAPKTVYGESKALGEKLVAENTDKYFIVRTAWLYGDGKNFVKTMLSLAKTHSHLTVVNDQIGSPTSTVDLAKAILALTQTEAYGLYHGTCEGQCSWFDFAKEIFHLADVDIDVAPVTSEEYPSKTPRPKYSVLENKALNDLGLNSFRPWQDAIAEYIAALPETLKH